MCHSLELTGKKVIPRLIAEQIYIFEKGSSTKSYNIDWLVWDLFLKTAFILQVICLRRSRKKLLASDEEKSLFIQLLTEGIGPQENFKYT